MKSVGISVFKPLSSNSSFHKKEKGTIALNERGEAELRSSFMR